MERTSGGVITDWLQGTPKKAAPGCYEVDLRGLCFGRRYNKPPAGRPGAREQENQTVRRRRRSNRAAPERARQRRARPISESVGTSITDWPTTVTEVGSPTAAVAGLSVEQ